MEAGLDCVAVTDHNSGDWIDELKAKNSEIQALDEKPDWYKELTIFPGVEITVADSGTRVHLLAVFDPDCDSQKVTSVLGSCRITSGFGDAQNTSTTTSFIDTVKKINEANGIAIPAHIDGSKGLLKDVSGLTPELEKSLKAVYAAEFCNLHEFDNADPKLKKSVDQLAKLAGSDSHNPGKIGQHSSWVKMSRPSIEGLRLALQDREYCVRNQSSDPNRLPDMFLTGLTICKMNHCGHIPGHPFEVQLHPHLNSIIGGRGAGKSTLLESIRIAARRDQGLAVESPRTKDDLDRFMGASQDKGVMRGDTEILLELHRRGGEYRLRWKHDGEGAVLEEKSEGNWQAVEGGDLGERFPISIFSQKQINEMASNPRGLLEIVDRSPAVDRSEWTSRWESTKSNFMQLRERRRELLRQLEEEEQIRAKLSDVQKDLKQYEEKGHGEVLRQYQKRSQQVNGISGNRMFDDLSSSIKELVPGTEMSDFPDHLFDDQDETTRGVREIHNQTAQALKEIGISLMKVAERVDTLKENRSKDILSSKWQKVVDESFVAYEKLIKEYEERQGQIGMAIYGEWVKQRDQLQQQLTRLDAVRKEEKAIEKDIQEALNQLQALRLELFDKREKFLDRVIGSSEYVRMELVLYGDVSALESEYRNLLNLDGESFSSSVYDSDNQQGILWSLSQWGSDASESDLPGLVSDIKTRTMRIARGEESGAHGKFDNRLHGMYEAQPSAFDHLDAWWPEDLLRVKYSRDPSSNHFDDLDKGSAGQKAAAILAFLLSHGEEPLIIDQPEDDLENALIYDLIVKQIHENKDRRQIILATHNANIVVNGDSELVHVLKFENGQVQVGQQGGLEEKSIRDSICTILEGGQEAFDKRYKRITLEA